MHWAIIDTSVYIDHWERRLHDETLGRIRNQFIVRHSSVVLSELRRGARTKSAHRLIEGLHRLARVQWSPTAADWWQAGQLIRTIADRQRWDRSKKLEFQNDTLIALSARRHGAAIVTTNRADFDLLGRELSVAIVHV